MAVFDCADEMSSYHAERVTLGKAQQQEMHNRREGGRTRLRKNLQDYGMPLPLELASQGSYAMRTMVQDGANDYDIDDGAYFAADALVNADGQAYSPREVRERVRDALRSDGRLKHPAEAKENCVRQVYPEGYHIDIPTYRRRVAAGADGTTVDVHELASGDKWIESDARGVTAWFTAIVGELNRDTPDGSQLRRVVKLTKKFARSRDEWKASTTSGICITVLVQAAFVPVEGRDDEALLKTWKAIQQRPPGEKVPHPVLPTPLANAWDPKVTYFRECLRSALGTLSVLEKDGCTRADARAAWDDVFNTDFFTNQPDDEGGDDDGGGGGKRSIVVPAGDAVQRKDGGRRFG